MLILLKTALKLFIDNNRIWKGEIKYLTLMVSFYDKYIVSVSKDE